jgi:VWFA-related protein
MTGGTKRLLVAGASLCLAVSVLAAQQVPQFRAGVDVVEVEATILDANRRPVRGLSQAHFTILENDKPQPIILFSEEEYPEADGPLSTAVEDTAPDVSQRRYADRRLIAVVVDDYALPSGLGASMPLVRDMKSIVTDIVDHMGLKDFVSIVHTRDTRYFPDFTNNRRKLFDSIAAIEPPLPLERAYLQMITRNQMGGLPALQSVVDYMAKWPQHRKVIVYVSSGSGGGSFQGRTLYRMIDLIKAAREAGISISAIDPGGLRISTGGLAQLKTLADETGGYAGINSNDLQRPVEQIFQETRSYYLIGYERTGPNDGKFRKLELRVNRPGLLITTRTGVYAPGPRDIIVKGPVPFDPDVDVAVESLARTTNGRPWAAYSVQHRDSLTVVGELSAIEVAAKRWAGGANVEAIVTRGAGTLVTSQRGRVVAGERSVAFELPVPAGGDGAYHVSIKAVASDGATLENGGDPTPPTGLLEAPTVFRAGAAPRAPWHPVAEFQFARTERMRLEFGELKPTTDRMVRVLRRTGEALNVEPLIGQKSIDGKTIVTAEFRLSFLAQGEYAFELLARSGSEFERKLIAFRVR